MDRTKYDLKIKNDDGVNNFQSLDKVETAFKIIECLLDLKLESKEEINAHKFIRYKLLLSKDELKEKTPNIQGRYKRNLENHDLYFSRMWNKEELENLITYVEENYGNVFSISESILNSDANINLLPEILEVLEEGPIIDFCELEEFRYQKGSDKLIEFENYDGLKKEEITLLLNQFNESGLTFTNFVKALNIESVEYQLLTLLGELVSYCDLHAANKKVYNQYDDNRTLGKAGVRMNDWLDKLLTYKITDNDLSKLTPSIKNALLYLKDPEKGLTMLSENHREKFSISLLDKTYIAESIVDDLISFFEPYEIEVSNEKNRTSVYCSVLYSKKVKRLWLDDDNTEGEEEKSNTKNTKLMNIPLNQIFYGPPGTGKTYNISSEAEKIINLKSASSTLDRNKKFDIVLKNIRHRYQDKIYNTRNGNVIYRNFSKAINIWGYFLSPEYDAQNTLIHEELKNVTGFVRSGWSQRMKYVTEFDFIEGNWQSDLSGQLGFDLSLSDLGISFKEKIRNYISENNYTALDLKEWDREKGIPRVFSEQYCEVLGQVKPLLENMTAFKKSLICALNMCLNNDLFRQNNESRNSTEEEIDLARKYFDINNLNTSDYKWVGWYAENLIDLGLVKQKDEEFDDKFFYELTTEGLQLIDRIIKNWQTEMPSLFGSKLNYEDAVSLGQVDFITFHQSYSYEEFIEGIRPNLGDHDLTYSLEPGIFKRLSDFARWDQDNNYVIIIDEINRGNISKIFGELITLIEPSKRLLSEDPNEHPKQVRLPYSKKLFGVPKNLYILGTMNTADKSIALLDSALRRRFSFTEMPPNSSVIKENISIEGIEVEKLFETINSRIEFLIDKDHTIGHSYFLKIKDNQTIEALALIFKNEIIPLLTEYFYGDFEKIQLVLGDNKDWKSKGDSKFFSIKPSQQKALFGKEEAVEGYDEKIMFELNDDLLGLNKDGNIKGNADQLVQLFKSVYTQKSN
ncbi:AAA family ATPase [Aequorivita sinensis]|uniref:AAA family ATPase n=1 Tax=Aequorivita sinensis TaxID=1382458 RepID=UPI002300CFB3|nr:AAA family ATPase [Aequorivita sinensis]